MTKPTASSVASAPARMSLITRLACAFLLTALGTPTSAQLVADFTATPTTGVNPLTVSFTDATTGGTPITWIWTFDDGGGSFAKDPVHTYISPGTYTVSLLVFGPGGSDFEEKTDLITVDPAPLVVDFTATPTSGVNPLTVAFADASTGVTTTSWNWDFGDGGTSSLQNPMHTYNGPGTYTVSLTAFFGGQSDTLVKTDVITVDPAPVIVGFTASPIEGVNPLDVAFTDTTTGATLTGWSWDFGDGGTSTLQNPSHTYQVAESTSFTVSLTTFFGGQSDTLVKTDVITVDPASVVVDFTASPTQGVNPLTVAFTDTSSGAAFTSRLWDFGDGAASASQTPMHQYTAPGDYTVSLTMFVGPQSDTTVKTDFITVDPAPLVVDFTATPTQGANPLEVNFTDTSTGATTTAWIWDFGDGYGSTQHNPTHTYTFPGTHDVSLTAFVKQQSGVLVQSGLVTVAHALLIDPLFNAQAFDGGLGIALGDLDGDGTLDLVEVGTKVRVLLGQGDGGFEFVGVHDVGDYPRDVVIADFDGDGTPDLATADREANQVSVLLGQGDGDFSLHGSFEVGLWPVSLAAGDFDADGVLDLVTADSLSDQVSILLGDGSGGFTLDASYDVLGLQPEFVGVGDFNGDGIADLTTVNAGSSKSQVWGISVLLGQGDGSFVLTDEVQLGPIARYGALGDFNEDGMLDVAVVEEVQDTVQILLGQGNGELAYGPSIALDVGSGPRAIATADVDGDGLLDLVTADLLGNTVSILIGQGLGGFTLFRTYHAGYKPSAIKLADVDGNGELDVLVGQSGHVRVLRGVGDGTFLDNATYAVGDGPYAVAVGDFDGDGFADLATADTYAHTVSVLLGLGDGSFSPGGTFGVVETFPGALAVADLDDDGALDLVTVHSVSDAVSILLGQGDGSFVPDGSYAVDPRPFDVVVAHLDGDGIPDLATVNFDPDTVTVLLGLGDGSFLTGVSYGVGYNPRALAAGDLDGDGAQDLITANFGSVTVLLGQGDGSFVSGGSYSVGGSPRDVAVGDLDRDGIPDLVTPIYDPFSGSVSILWGKGDGSFSDAESIPVAGRLLQSVALTDFDGDGHLDIVTANEGSDTVGVLLGDGTGAFTASGVFGVDRNPISLAVGDFDGNGKPDLVTAHWITDTVSILLNQLDAWANLASGLPGVTGIPYLEGTGTLEVGSAGSLTLSNAAPSSLAMLFISTTNTPSPFKCGTLVPVPPLLSVLLSTDSGGVFVLPWLSWPSGFTGQSVYFQYAIQDEAAVCGVSLSNAVRADVP